jgi:hypothetical protein
MGSIFITPKAAVAVDCKNALMHVIQSESKSTGEAVETLFVGYQIVKPHFVTIFVLK